MYTVNQVGICHNPGTQEVEAGGSEVQDHPRLHMSLKPTRNPVLKKRDRCLGQEGAGTFICFALDSQGLCNEERPFVT